MDEDRNWADLTSDVLHRIHTLLRPDLGDFVRFRAVCKGWRNFDSIPDSPPKTVWLLECGDPGCPKPNLSFYSLASHQTGVIPVPEQWHGMKYYGPGHGYLLGLCPEENPYLLNPLTGNKILLPKLNHDGSFISSLVCSGLGPRLNWYIVYHDEKENAWKCIIYHQDRNNWTYVKVDICDTSCRTCCFNGVLFATDDGCSTEVYDAISGQKLYEVPRPADETTFQLVSTHLVESSGDILRVCLYVGEEDSDEIEDPDEIEDYDEIVDSIFEIHKLCSKEEGGRTIFFWVKVTDIGNQILFLDGVNGFSLKAPPGLNGNCIYFMSEDHSQPWRYDIGTGVVQEVPCPFNRYTLFIPCLD